MRTSAPLINAIFALFAASLLASCGGDYSIGGEPLPTELVAGAPGDSTLPAPVPPATDNPFHARVIELTNQYRAANGVAPLKYNAALTRAAQDFAQLMADQNFFSHTSPDGTGPGTRIERAGYDAYTWGENIGMGYVTAEQVMQGWINSAGHRANLLNSAFKEIGVGYAKGSSAYWVQNFGTQ